MSLKPLLVFSAVLFPQPEKLRSEEKTREEHGETDKAVNRTDADAVLRVYTVRYTGRAVQGAPTRVYREGIYQAVHHPGYTRRGIASPP